MKKYFNQNKKELSLWLLFQLFTALSMVYWSLFMAKLYDASKSGDGLKNLFVFGGIFIVLYIVISIFRVKYKREFIRKSNVSLKKDMYSVIMSKNLNEYNSRNSAEYISMLNNNAKIIENDYFYVVPEIFSSMIMMLVAVIALFLYNYKIAIVVLLLNSMPFVIPKLYGDKVGSLKMNYTSSLDNFNVKIKDIFSAFEVVKSYNVEKEMYAEYEAALNTVEDNKYKYIFKASVLQAISWASGYLIGVITLGFSAYLIYKGEISMGILLGTMQISNYVAGPARDMNEDYLTYKSTKKLADEVSDFLNESKESIEELDVISDVPFVEVKNLSFAYNDEKKILKNISHKFDRNKKYAIVGYSGSGKSTLLKVMIGNYLQYDGYILYGDNNLSSIKLESLYGIIAHIHQEVILFNDTIRNNVSMYKKYGDDDIVQAMRDAGMEDYLREKGLSAIIEENGQNMSGGEKQRISIARAFLKGTKVLFTDEATSSLDYETGYKIENLLLEKDDLTLISVTHKLDENLLKKYDEIIVMNDGEIVESGNFEDLINNNSYFKSLYLIGK